MYELITLIMVVIAIYMIFTVMIAVSELKAEIEHMRPIIENIAHRLPRTRP